MKILLGTLKDKGNDLATFLEPRIGVKPEVSGGEIDIEDKSLRKGVGSRHVKTYIKRFLSIEKVRSDYRVLVDSGELRLVQLEREEEEEEEDADKKKAKEKERKEEEEKGQAAAEKEGTTAAESGSETSEKGQGAK
jgi:hypothetical protein